MLLGFLFFLFPTSKSVRGKGFVEPVQNPRKTTDRPFFPKTFSTEFSHPKRYFVVKKLIKMVKSGLAKGVNSGHVTNEIEREPKPSRRKGVSSLCCRIAAV